MWVAENGGKLNSNHGRGDAKEKTNPGGILRQCKD
jgi:hypothetical protein